MGAALAGAITGGCAGIDTPSTDVVLDNDYPSSQNPVLVVYEAFWETTSFSTPLPPGASSGAQPTVPCSANTAWVVLAPGWDPASSTPPTSFVLLQSRAGFGVDLGQTLHIGVDDQTFAGNCAAGSALSQDEADFMTQRVFPTTFAGLTYDAAHCTTVPAPGADAGSGGADDAEGGAIDDAAAGAVAEDGDP